MVKSVAVGFTDYQVSVAKALEKSGFSEKIRDEKRIIVKPNLLEDIGPPTTTDVRCIEAIITYIREHFENKEIIIAEGSGGCPTGQAFSKLGYTALSERLEVTLVDLDSVKTVECAVPSPKQWKTIYLPETVLDGFIISAAVLKHHTITQITLCLKNMIGILPEKHYSGYWSYKKSQVHNGNVELAIRDINAVRPIGWGVIDGAIGQKGSHLAGGIPFDPPIAKIISCENPVEADIEGCTFLSVDPYDVDHIQLCKRIYPNE